MTVKIPKSVIQEAPGLELAIAEFAEKLRNWREHMKRVEADKAKGDELDPILRHQPYGRPHAPELIESAVDANGNPDYEIEDDSDMILRRQKDALLARVSVLEQAAMRTLVPAGKERFFLMREAEIRNADAERGAALIERRKKPGFVKRLLGSGEEFDLAAAVAEQRPEDDSKHLAEQQERRQRATAINKIAAEAMHDIEDLTADTIGSWQDPDFSGV